MSRLLMSAHVVLLTVAQFACAQDSVEVFIPPAISPHDLECSKRLLMSSEAQSLIVDRLYVEYSEQWKAIHDQHEPAVRAAALEAGSHFLTENGEFGQPAVDAFARMEELRTALLMKSKVIDDAFFNQVQALLAEPQLLNLHRVRQHRSRDRCRLTHRALASSQVDLERILRVLGCDAAPGSELDLLVAEYDAAISSPWLELDERLLRIEIAEFQAAVDLLFALPPPGADRSAGDVNYTERVRSLQRPALRLQRRIATLNRVFMPQVASLLTIEQRDRFQALCSRMSYPGIYPDPFEASGVYARLDGAMQAAAELRAVLRGMWIDYKEGYGAINLLLERKEDERRAEFASTRGSIRLGEIQEEIQQARQERSNRNKAFVDGLFAALPPEVAAEYKIVFDDYHQRTAAYQRALGAIGQAR